jgi:hypothetical protein
MGKSVTSYINQICHGNPVFPSRENVREVLFAALEEFAKKHDKQEGTAFFDEWFEHPIVGKSMKGGYRGWYKLMDDRYYSRTNLMVRL